MKLEPGAAESPHRHTGALLGVEHRERTAWLDGGGTPTRLHSAISTNRHRVAVSEPPMYPDALPADRPMPAGRGRVLATRTCAR